MTWALEDITGHYFHLDAVRAVAQWGTNNAIQFCQLTVGFALHIGTIVNGHVNFFVADEGNRLKNPENQTYVVRT